MPPITITKIATQKELELYQTELAATKKEQDSYTQLIAKLKLNGQENQENLKTAMHRERELANAIELLEMQIDDYHTLIESKQKKRQKTEAKISNVVNPTLGLGWSFLLGIGVILKETAKVAAPVLNVFLFPLHFTLEGIRSIWAIYQTMRDKNAAQRKTILGTSIVHIAGLIAAATVTALAVTNPFALPVIFIGLTGAGLYKNLYVLNQTNKLIKTTESTIHDTDLLITNIKENLLLLNKTDLDGRQALQAKLEMQQAKHARLNEQLINLKAKRFEQRRELIFNTLGMVAVGLLLTSAVLSLVFPPAAAAVAGVGMLLFASVVITNVLTSPPVRAKIKQFGGWLKNLFDSSNAYKPIATKENNDKPQEGLIANPIENVDDIQAPLLTAANDELLPTTHVKHHETKVSHSSANMGFFKPNTTATKPTIVEDSSAAPEITSIKP